MKRSHLAIIILLLVLLIDQSLKIWIKTSFQLQHEFGILGLSWARIHFTENEGMAFGMELGGSYGKLLLSTFRIIAVGFIGYYLFRLIKQNASKSLIISITLIFGGAIGNILDSIFYGILFSDSYNRVAEFMPEHGGYAKMLYGHVVDMFYFPLIDGTYPDWMPIIGGNYYQYFRPVFNVADTAISIGVVSILIFNRSIFSDEKKSVKIKPDETILSDENKPE